MPLLTVLIVENSHVLTGFCFIFLNQSPISNLKGFQYQIRTSRESSYQVRQISAVFFKVVAIILGKNYVKGFKVTEIAKQIKFEGV